jgi:3-methyl-2-oxobutanoate hydroxymethyltransferase
MNPGFKPKFVKRYADLHGTITGAAAAFFSEVRAGSFPDEEHSFHSKTLRLVASNAHPEHESPEGGEKVGPIYGVPV